VFVVDVCDSLVCLGVKAPIICDASMIQSALWSLQMIGQIILVPSEGGIIVLLLAAQTTNVAQQSV